MPVSAAPKFFRTPMRLTPGDREQAAERVIRFSFSQNASYDSVYIYISYAPRHPENHSSSNERQNGETRSTPSDDSHRTERWHQGHGVQTEFVEKHAPPEVGRDSGSGDILLFRPQTESSLRIQRERQDGGRQEPDNDVQNRFHAEASRITIVISGSLAILSRRTFASSCSPRSATSSISLPHVTSDRIPESCH